MKKLLSIALLFALALGGSRQASAVDVSNGRGTAVTQYGGTIQDNSLLLFSAKPGGKVAIARTMIAAVNITQGDALVIVAGKKVSKTATVGDVNFYGFAAETAAYGTNVQVQTSGVCYARVGTSQTVGDRMVMSANAGFLTPTSAVTAANYTSVSGTPVVARILDTYTYVSYAPTALVSIGDKF